MITIEAVNPKPFNPKYSNGSVLAGGTWMQVNKTIAIENFVKGEQISVETKTNDKGYKSITAVVEPPKTTVEPFKRVTKLKHVETTTSDSSETPKTEVKTYEESKNKRIQVQGIIQSCMASAATINFGNEPEEIAEKVLKLADLLIAGMDARV